MKDKHKKARAHNAGFVVFRFAKQKQLFGFVAGAVRIQKLKL